MAGFGTGRFYTNAGKLIVDIGVAVKRIHYWIEHIVERVSRSLEWTSCVLHYKSILPCIRTIKLGLTLLTNCVYCLSERAPDLKNPKFTNQTTRLILYFSLFQPYFDFHEKVVISANFFKKWWWISYRSFR